MAMLPDDLQKLPPDAPEIIRYLAGQPQGAAVAAILAGTGIGERSFGKAIRRLVTRFYVTMPAPGVYTLTAIGREAAALLGPAPAASPEQTLVAPPAPSTPADAPSEVAPAAPRPAALLRHPRRLSTFLPRELIQQMPTQVQVGFGPAGTAAPPLAAPLPVQLRLDAPGCEVTPAERMLEVGMGAVGPAVFRLTPHIAGPLRLTVTVLQALGTGALVATGSMFFEVRVAAQPTPASAAFVTFTAEVRLVIGE